MSLIVGLLATLIGLGVLAYVLWRMETRKAAQGLRIVLGLSGVILGALLTIRGLAIVGGPILVAGLGFLGSALRGGRPVNAGQGQGPNASPPMTRQEAAKLLGISEAASEDEIHAAYKAMMKRVHPDAGGSDALAAQVQAAYELLKVKD
jgi:DnaJ-domain-containing protein 1